MKLFWSWSQKILSLNSQEKTSHTDFIFTRMYRMSVFITSFSIKSRFYFDIKRERIQLNISFITQNTIFALIKIKAILDSLKNIQVFIGIDFSHIDALMHIWLYTMSTFVYLHAVFTNISGI